MQVVNVSAGSIELSAELESSKYCTHYSYRAYSYCKAHIGIALYYSVPMKKYIRITYPRETLSTRNIIYEVE